MINGETELHEAIAEGDYRKFRKALKKADLNAGDDEGSTPLMYCVFFHRKAMFDQLIEAGADIEARNSYGYRVEQYVIHNELDW